MKWGESLNVPYLQGDLGLLYHVLEFFVQEYFSQDYAKILNNSLLESLFNGSGMGNGNMNWDIDRLEEDGIVIFDVSSDPEFLSDGIPSQAVFTEVFFRETFKKILLAFSTEYPDSKCEVTKIIKHFNL